MALCPGLMGSFGHSGIVHWHDPFASEIISATAPVLITLNSQSPLAPPMFAKSIDLCY